MFTPSIAKFVELLSDRKPEAPRVPVGEDEDND
jgi:hypothetical protein